MKPRIYTEEEHAFMREFVPGHSYKEIREEFLARFGGEVTKSFPSSYITNHGLNTGRNGWFEKGHVPANKGKKMSPAQYEKCKCTMFKKGQKPVNTAAIGEESKKSEDDYVYVKIADEDVPSRFNWKEKHRIIYEEHYGPVPEGHVVIFLDGNKRNFDPENLLAIPKAVHARMNQSHLKFDDPELTRAGAEIAKVKTRVGKRSRGEKEK